MHAQLVPSIAGKFEGWPSVLRVGHVRLMRAIRQIGARSDLERSKPQSLSTDRRKTRCRKLYLECQVSPPLKKYDLHYIHRRVRLPLDLVDRILHPFLD